jgi:pimeloyl-ACP methyl ester carboxylesterase
VPAEENLALTVRGVEIPCRISRPAARPRGALLLLPGSLFSDIDGNYPSMNMRPHAYADMAGQLARLGILVMRMAKIGPGTGSRTIDAAAAAAHADFGTRVEVAAEALARLAALRTPGPLIVAGHSEGALVAFLLAAGRPGTPVDGVVSLSGPALPILGILRGQIGAMAPPGSGPPDLSPYDQAVSAIRRGVPLPSELAQNPQTAMLATMPPAALAYLASVDRIDPLKVVARVRQPMLIVQGGRDFSVPATHAERLRAARSNLPTELALFPALTHFYKVAPEGLTPMRSMMLESESDPAVAGAIAAWAARLPRR